MKKILFCLLLVLQTVYADNFSASTEYQVCFTPGGYCASKIAHAINDAKHNVDVQVYSFTSKKIAYALRDAVRRGVAVTVIYDAENFNPDYFSLAKTVTDSGAKCSVDDTVSIAHNKVIIIDGKVVVTGSFNFTYAAEHKNAENVLIIHDKKLAAKYAANFAKRQAVSENCIF